MLMIYLEFIFFAVLIIFFGFKLSQYGQLIARKRLISEALFGLVFLAIITSLPEIITSIGSVTLVDAPDMAVATAVGSILFNLLILAILDFLQGQGGILSVLSDRSHVLTAALTIVVLGIVALSIIQRAVIGFQFGFMHIGYESLLLILIYILAVRTLGRHAVQTAGAEDSKPEEAHRFWIKFAISGFMVIISGLFLARIGEQIVINTGKSEAFVGLVFLAVVTSLPELIVSISALRLGSIDMAVGNILGSNFFDTILVPISDVFYTKSQLLSTISISHIFIITLCLVFSGLIIGGLVYRSKRSFLRLGWDIIAMLIIFALSVFFLYHIR
jgi:cation:H+ antiporter